MLYWKYFAEDNICSLIINVKPELKMSKDTLPIAKLMTVSPAQSGRCVTRIWARRIGEGSRDSKWEEMRGGMEFRASATILMHTG